MSLDKVDTFENFSVIKTIGVHIFNFAVVII